MGPSVLLVKFPINFHCKVPFNHQNLQLPDSYYVLMMYGV